MSDEFRIVNVMIRDVEEKIRPLKNQLDALSSKLSDARKLAKEIKTKLEKK